MWALSSVLSRLQFSKARLLRGYHLPEGLIESHMPCEILMAQLWLGFPHWTKPTGITFIIDVSKSELSLTLSQVGIALFCYSINQTSENANALRNKWRSPTLKQDIGHWMLLHLEFLKNFLFTSSVYSVYFSVDQLFALSFSIQVHALDLLNIPFLFCLPHPRHWFWDHSGSPDIIFRCHTWFMTNVGPTWASSWLLASIFSPSTLWKGILLFFKHTFDVLHTLCRGSIMSWLSRKKGKSCFL